jgi:hypothetical protein
VPIACDPNATYEFVLKSDQEKPEPRATFIFRHLVMRQKRIYRKLEQRKDNELRDLGADQVIEKLYECLAQVLVGWRDLKDAAGAAVAFPSAEAKSPKPEALQSLLDDLLTEGELWELYWAAIHELSESDRKNFESLLNTASAGSAADSAKSA